MIHGLHPDDYCRIMKGVSPYWEDFAALLGKESLRWWIGLNAYLAGLYPRLEPLDEYRVPIEES